jgi:SAM-dependent methyltransferase
VSFPDPRRQWLEREFERLGPWITQFRIHGGVYGGSTSYAHDQRIEHFNNAFPDVGTILELGSLEGGQSFRLAERPGAQVVAVEARAENVERARFVQQALQIANVRFAVADLERTRPGTFGTFDAVFCSGLLYHLREPWTFLDSLREAAPRLLLWTHYADHVEDEVARIPGHWYEERDTTHPLSGLSSRSFFMTREAIVQRLRSAGFASVEIVDDDPQHEPFACLTLVARDASG